jgi:hypothetical protein
LREWITTDCRNTSSATNAEDEEIVDALGNDGNASMPEEVKRSNPWRKMMMMIVTYPKTLGPNMILKKLRRQMQVEIRLGKGNS